MTSRALKRIAIIAMLTDHIAKIYGVLFSGIPPQNSQVETLSSAFMIIIGRLTFPIMAFFVAEGCRKTSNIYKYMVRVFAFAFLSQVPYTLAMSFQNGLYIKTGNPFAQFSTHLTFFSIQPLNVLFTLGLGILTVIVYEKCKNRALAYFLSGLVVVSGAFLGVDYSSYGVLLVFVAYIFPTRKKQLLGMAVVLSVLYLCYCNGISDTVRILTSAEPAAEKFFNVAVLGLGEWFSSLITLLLLYFYNGERGKYAKYMFYIFYPAHFLLLFTIREIIRVYI